MSTASSELTELDVITRFLNETIPNGFIPDQIALPNSEEHSLRKNLTENGFGAALEDTAIGSFSGPDIVGHDSSSDTVYIMEAKGGNRVPNNAKHDLVDVLLRNIHPSEPCQSSIIIPSDQAQLFHTRLINKNEGYQEKLAEKGILAAIDGLKDQLPNNIEFMAYFVGDTIHSMPFTEFIKNGPNF